MTPYDKLKKKRNNITKEITELQSSCLHPPEHVTYMYESSSGNYDPSQDSYWTAFECAWCGKHWSEDTHHIDKSRGTRIRK